MIPKIIHYCWLSGDPFPSDILACMNSWKKQLSDYEFILWDLTRFDINSSNWVKQAFECKKYAFASDYIRLFALYNYGGVYLDTDVEVIKSFNGLLHFPYFLCKEETIHGIEAATLGAEKGTQWIGDCLKHYEGRNFLVNGKMDQRVLPEVINNSLLAHGYSLNYISNPEEFVINKKYINILSSDYFSPKNHSSKRIITTENTYSIHHFAASWSDNQSRLQKIQKKFKYQILFKILPPTVISYILKLKKRNREKWYDTKL